MSKTCKRLSALFLAICLVLSVMVPAAFATGTKTVRYDFDYMSQGLTTAGNSVLTDDAAAAIEALNKNYTDGNLNWGFKDIDFTSQSQNDATFERMGTKPDYYGFFRGRALVGDWVALNIKNPGAGEWTLSLDYAQSCYGANKVNVYILPSNTLDISMGLTDANLIGSYCCFDEAITIEKNADQATYKTTELGKWTPDASAEEYILVFQAAEANPAGKNVQGTDDNTRNSQAANIYFIEMNMTAEVADAPIEIEPEKYVGPIDPTAASINAISSYTVKYIVTDEVNGQDYAYLVFQGGTMGVVNVDTGELVDMKTDVLSTPRGVYVDKNDIVWVCGSQYFLYRYDPHTKEGRRIDIPEEVFPKTTSFNIWGITGDEATGKIYFGTYDIGQLGCYDPATKTFTNVTGEMNPDVMYSGTGGIVVHEGYAYVSMDGDKNGDGTMVHQIAKVDLATGKIVATVDTTEQLASKNTDNAAAGLYPGYLTLVGDVLFGSIQYGLHKPIAVDINTMQQIEIEGLTSGIWGDISVEKDGKAYFFDINKELQVYDTATKKVTPVGITGSYRLEGNQCFATYPDVAGTSLVTYRCNSTGVWLHIYHLETKETTILNNVCQGSGNQLRAVEISEDGKTIYLGAYGINHMSLYDVTAGKIVKQFGTYSHQIEGIYLYDGVLYAGNYGACGISIIDPEKGTYQQLFQLEESAFYQERMHAFTAGDGMVFAGTAPRKGRVGGVLSWYDIDENRIYVAAGPDKEDVYYTPAGNTSATGWYSVVTGQLADMDDNDDGKDDSVVNGAQRFTGLVENQSIIGMVYQDGYIYGCTSVYGGSGTGVTETTKNACIFVYDVKNMELVESYDLTKSFPGLLTPVELIDGIVADPEVDGKFWGVVSNTLFSFCYDFTKGEFTVTEELCLSTDAIEYKKTGNQWQSRSIIMDGDYMYVVFMDHGTYMVERDNPDNYYQLSTVIPKRMVLAADGNLYYHANTNDLMCLEIGGIAKYIKESGTAAADDVKALIDAIGTVSLASEEAIKAARAAYDALNPHQQTLVINASKLTDAEAALAALKAAAEKEAADKAVAEAVSTQIEAIGTVTLESEEAIKTARAAYEALTADQKKLVDEAKLTAAEKKLAELKAEKEAVEKEAADKAAAEAVTAQIAAIGTVTKDSKAAIEAARAAYEALTADQKTLVTNLNVLTAAESALAALEESTENPKTGEMTNMAAFAAVLITSAAALSLVLVSDIRRKHI